MTDQPVLPTGFGVLEPLVLVWALPTEATRFQQRLSVSLEELKRFYDALMPLMEEIMGHLAAADADLDMAPPPTRNLYLLALAFMEASHPIELRWRSVDLAEAFPATRIEYRVPSSVS